MRFGGVDAGQTLHARGEVVVGFRPIHHPPAIATGTARCGTPAPMKLRQVGVFEANEMELAFFGEDGTRAAVVAPSQSEALRHRCKREGCEHADEGEGLDAHSA